MALGLNGIFVGGVAHKNHLLGAHFKRLSLGLRTHYFARHLYRRTVFILTYFFVILGVVDGVNYLNMLKTRSVLKIYKAETLLFTVISYPSRKRNFFADIFFYMLI